MKKSRRKNFKLKASFILGILVGMFLVYLATNSVGFFVPQKASAVSFDYGLGSSLGLGTADLLDTVISVLQWILGLLGLVAVIIVLYGGFVWMTAGGNQEKIKKAKKILMNALIGLAIILLSWAIVYFVMGIINNSTNPSPASCGSGPPCTSPEICCPGYDYCDLPANCPVGPGFTPEFIIRSFATACEDSLAPHEDVFLCSSIAINFNNVIQIPTVENAVNAGDLIIEKCDDGAACTTTSAPAPLLDPQVWSGSTPQGVNSEWVAASKSIVFYHIPYLFEAFTYYRVTITEEITDTDGREITKCEKEGGTPIPGCVLNSGKWTWIFQTNDEVDTVPPEIVQASPEFDTTKTPPQYPNRNVSMAPIIWANFSEMIDPITVTEANITVSPIDINSGPTFDPNTGQGGTLLGSLNPDQYNVYINGNGNGFQWQLENNPSIWPQPNYLNAYSWYEINVDNIRDLCANEMTPAPTTWRFQTNGTFPGVNFVYPPDGYQFSCPDTEVFAQFNTTMYDIATGSCGVAPSGGGFVTGGTLSNGAGRVLGVEDNYPGSPADPNYYCKKYSWVPITNSLPTDSDHAAHINTRMVIDAEQNLLEADWGFHVTQPGSCANPPYITNLSPSYGPVGQCLSVQGNYFGTGGDPQDRVELGGIQTPVNAGAWTDHNIATVVPAGTPQGVQNTKVFVYHPAPINQVLESNEFPFQVDPGTFDGPCIDYISPTSGTSGTGVTIVGTNFNPASSTKEVWFTYGAYSAGYNGWGETQITSTVPSGAGDGDVTVQNDGGISNGVYFDVIPTYPGTPTVVQNSFCDYEPPPPDDVYASPTPWLNQNNICFNTVVSARFNIDPGLNSMDSGTFNNTNIYLDKCTDGEPCTTTSRVTPVTITSHRYLDPNDMFKLTPSNDLEQSTWYKATITTGVKSAAGMPLAQDYIWKFRTKDDPGNCPLSGVGIAPPSATINWDGTIDYDSDPIGPNCQILNPGSYTWSWNSTYVNRAYIVGNPTGETATARSANNQEGPTWIQATTEGITGQALLNVDFGGCQTDPSICTDSTRGGCPGSVCNASGECTPVIDDISPAVCKGAGCPIGQYITVSGCWFGPYTSGVSQVDFLGGNPPTTTETAKWPEACGPPGSTWGSNEIIIEVPEDETSQTSDDAETGPMKVSVQGNSGVYYDTTANIDPGSVFDYVHADGVAVNLCPFNPNWGYNNDSFIAIGEGFDNGTNDSISFYDGAGRVNAIILPGNWTNTQIDSTVPTQAITSTPPINGVEVRTDRSPLPSNQVLFTVRCDDDTQCAATHCCYNNECKEAAYCSTGGPGDLCQIPSNDNCLIGPSGWPSSYNCISDTGDIEGTPPPPPAFPDPSFGDDCRVCCEPGQTYNNLICTADIDDCSGSERGLYCGCTTDPECGDPNNIGCGTTTPRCCYERPNVENTEPANNETGVCINSAIVVEFDRLMNPASINTGTFAVERGSWGSGYGLIGNVSVYNQNGKTSASFLPDTNFQPYEVYSVEVKGDPDLNDGNPVGVLSSYLVGMNGPDVNNSYRFQFSTSDELCTIDHVEVWMIPPTLGAERYSDLFVCTGDACDGDQDPAPLNQHQYWALAMDDSGTMLSGVTYTWSDPFIGGIIDVITPDSQFSDVTALGPNGQANIQITADAGEQGQASTNVITTVDVCQTPWPANEPYVYPDAAIPTPPGEPTNFETRYCRDSGLPGIATPIIFQNPSYTYNNGTDEMIREIFFNPDDGSGDVIGIRVMENEGFLSARAWFDNTFPDDAAAGGSTVVVDGYQALKVGRTTYVAATNLVGTTLYPNIYLISYNDNAESSTVDIYNQMIENWFFNAHPTSMFWDCTAAPPDINKQCIIRDTKRVTELGEVGLSLLNYEDEHGNFPILSSGTYLNGLSTSKWPSWVSALGNELGTTLPTDPKNVFDPLTSCPVPPYDAAGTCWNDSAKVYTCPNNSHIYQYHASSNGANSELYARLEYQGTGNWANYTGTPNPCSGYSGSACSACFNYIINSADDFGINYNQSSNN
ncbi:MAG: hypothetical protein COY66_00555 [Candidatus Kerfeldbacteria bacterium CG_4_10_14_0_8_um_filter_42_10]|uniref:IPT/TIG domain-containing protein n=1 Tax=Candidatus Kerfeldbacteria bacterium CG_4_10_14_0_8_um_filter_42_10 TaxID=2014248 RepID=A0A2M7RKD4_9BACT|nr:MAG: hypothetical protein COY66_00555 [Candidatus Kerfeldbacteria bacterium CG_4_10_14_0_8_um_filter_42_10]